MPEKGTGQPLWVRLRKESWKDLDKLAADLVKRPFEKRQFAGDPKQARYFWIRTRNK